MKLGNWMRLAWDRAAAVVLMAAGAVALILGWDGVSGEAFPAKQLPYLISGGIAGVWTAHGRRLINLRRALLLGTAPPPAADRALSTDIVAGPSGKWFHRADCLLAEGRGWEPSPRPQHERAGRRPCPGCRP